MDIEKHDTDGFKIYSDGVKKAFDIHHEKFISEYLEKVLHPDDKEIIYGILNDYHKSFKETLDGIDDVLIRTKNIKFTTGGKNNES